MRHEDKKHKNKQNSNDNCLLVLLHVSLLTRNAIHFKAGMPKWYDVTSLVQLLGRKALEFVHTGACRSRSFQSEEQAVQTCSTG